MPFFTVYYKKKSLLMKILNFTLPSLLILLLFSGFKPAKNPDELLGTWLVGTKKAKVLIEKKEDKYYGKIIWLQEPNKPDGTPKKDQNNPDKSKRNNPIIGLKLIKGFEYKGNNVWENGKIYDPENGKEYSCIITLKDKNTIDVRGYIGISLIGRTDTWTKVQ
jgi:uncharacterized protein (DUF2147 family)